MTTLESFGIPSEKIDQMLGLKQTNKPDKPMWRFGTWEEKEFLYWDLAPQVPDWHFVLRPVPMMNVCYLLLRRTPVESHPPPLEICVFGVAQEAMEYCSEHYSELRDLLLAISKVYSNLPQTSVKTILEQTEQDPKETIKSWQKAEENSKLLTEMAELRTLRKSLGLSDVSETLLKEQVAQLRAAMELQTSLEMSSLADVLTPGEWKEWKVARVVEMERDRKEKVQQHSETPPADNEQNQIFHYPRFPRH